MKRITKERAWRGRTRLKTRVGCAVDALCSAEELRRIKARKPKKPAPRIHTNCEERRKAFATAYTAHIDGLRRRRTELAASIDDVVGESGPFSRAQFAPIQPRPT